MGDQSGEYVPPFKVIVYKTNTAPLQFEDVTEVKITALGVLVTHRWLDDGGDTREHSVSVRRHVIDQVVITHKAKHFAREGATDA